MDCLGHLQVEIEALSMEGPPSESKEARSPSVEDSLWVVMCLQNQSKRKTKQLWTGDYVRGEPMCPFST